MYRKRIVAAVMTNLFACGLSVGAQQILSPEQVKGKKILMVAGAPEKGETNDDALVKKHLESLGYTVSMGTEDDEASKAKGQDLVILSSTADPRELGDKYADVQCSCLYLEHGGFSGHEVDRTGTACRF